VTLWRRALSSPPQEVIEAQRAQATAHGNTHEFSNFLVSQRAALEAQADA
jgi:hypothetical protein